MQQLGFVIDDEHHYQIDPEKAPLVIEMFRRYAGGESITDIIEDLNARGIRTSKGNRFNKNSLARIFANRRYIGEYSYKEIVVPNAIPAIVSKDIFERVAIRMKQNKHATGKAKAPERYLLTTKLFCGTCQSMFVGDSANKPNGVIYRYYKCASAKRHECDRMTISQLTSPRPKKLNIWHIVRTFNRPLHQIIAIAIYGCRDFLIIRFGMRTLQAVSEVLVSVLLAQLAPSEARISISRTGHH